MTEHADLFPKYEIGIDEVGRGPLVGSVVAAAVLWPVDVELAGLTDSKKLSEKKRQSLVESIKNTALAYGIGEASAQEIDTLNILQATFLAMRRAVEQIDQFEIYPLFVDGNHCPGYPCTAVVKGDTKRQSIAAASVLAKVYRDAQMYQLHKTYPHYGFDRHKGYPTKAHLTAIQTYGILPEHRRSFKPIAQLR